MTTSTAAPAAPTRTTRPTRTLFSKASNSSTWIRNKVDTSFLQSRTFGRPNRPSTPIYGVITGQYQRDWEAEQAKAAARREKKSVKKVKAADVKAQHTLASLGHMKVEREAGKERFVMQRFDGVEKKVSTTWERMPGRRGDGQQKEREEEQKEQIVSAAY